MFTQHTPYVARVERVFHTGAGRYVRVVCPFCRLTHVHQWLESAPHPSREMVAHCSRPGRLATYAIDPDTAKKAAATAGKKLGPQVKVGRR